MSPMVRFQTKTAEVNNNIGYATLDNKINLSTTVLSRLTVASILSAR
jgi:hypothetical protein